jgi:tetratricopeptide (TPR) repeat protein
MPDIASQNIKSFDENIEVLFEELELAIKWERPSILLAIHKTKFGQDKAAHALELKLNRISRNIRHIVINNMHPDVPHDILATSDRDQTVFFVSNLDSGGGQDGRDAYRALNVYRELFVENRIKVVFWLTSGEAADLPHYAADFWSFRHRVIEFAAQRTHGNVNLPVGILIWQVQNSVDSFDRPEQRITARQEILAKLPLNNESLSTRVDLIYNIGYLYWVLGDSGKALQSFTEGIDLVKNDQLPRSRASLLNGTAIIHFEAGQYEKAIDLFRQALVDTPDDGSLLINISAACCALGRNQEAITSGKQAIRLYSEDAKTWNGLGHIYCAMGKFDEAISCFTKATQISPRVAAYQESLAVSYNAVERLDESKRVFLATRKLAGDQSSPLLDVYEAAATGDIEKSQLLLQTAFQAGQISRIEVLRDPNINLLFDRSQIDSLMQ